MRLKFLDNEGALRSELEFLLALLALPKLHELQLQLTGSENQLLLHSPA